MPRDKAVQMSRDAAVQMSTVSTAVQISRCRLCRQLCRCRGMLGCADVDYDDSCADVEMSTMSTAVQMSRDASVQMLTVSTAVQYRGMLGCADVDYVDSCADVEECICADVDIVGICGDTTTETHQTMDCTAITQRFPDVFPSDLLAGLPPQRAVDHRIEVEPGKRPPTRPTYNMSTSELAELKAQITEMQEKGFAPTPPHTQQMHADAFRKSDICADASFDICTDADNVDICTDAFLDICTAADIIDICTAKHPSTSAQLSTQSTSAQMHPSTSAQLST
ncbi:hypothetical protein QJQ45_023607 [Haematococcus lacustris]|nr:hypothetical protein QJQ45_023607 [Haematococcus lacustris]